MKSIQELQDEIVQDFSILEGDHEMTLFYVMELGQKLTPFPVDKKTDDYLVKGCQSKVWLNAYEEDGKIYFQADSNTAITKGLISLLIRVFNGQSPEDILTADLFFVQKIGMERFIGTQRSNGFAAMVKQMKLFALAIKQKLSIG